MTDNLPKPVDPRYDEASANPPVKKGIIKRFRTDDLGDGVALTDMPTKTDAVKTQRWITAYVGGEGYYNLGDMR